MDWNEINCRDCGRCNRKGKPSVMKGSAKCQENRYIIPKRDKRLGRRSVEFWAKLCGWSRKEK